MKYASVWEREYANKSEIWTGSPIHLPHLPRNARVLEIGCGNGKSLEAMSRKGWNLVGVDISPTALKLAGERLARSGTDAEVELVEADIRSLPFEGSSFDAVFAIHVLGHLLAVDRDQAMAEAARVLKPGGHFHMREFSVNDLRYGKGEEWEKHTFINSSGILKSFFTEGSMMELLAAHFAGQAIKVTTEAWSMAGGRGHRREEIVGEVNPLGPPGQQRSD